MKKAKIFAVVMAAVMTLSLVACGEKQTSNDVTPTTAPTTAPTEAPEVEPTTAPVAQNVAIADASITFEDGNYGFVAPYMKHVTSAEIELSIADYNGSKALKVVNLNGKAPWIAIDVNTLLGANAAKVAGIEMVVGTTYDDGNFYSTSGSIMSWWGTDLTQNTMGSWSIYMEKKNPKIISAKVPAGNELIADANNIIMINLATDNGMAEGANGGYATLYIDDIRFFDAAGNTITADTTVAFVNPAGFANEGHDSNLLYLSDAVDLMGEVSAGGWAQAGVDLTDEQRALFKPGTVLEVAYECADPVWMIAIGENPLGGWLRAVDQNTFVVDGYLSSDKTVVQYTYEQLAAWWGEGFEQYLTTLQCEGKSDWKVYSVKIGTQSTYADLGANKTQLCGEISAAGWAQTGVDLTDEQRALFKPGTVLEIAYECDKPVWPIAIGENPLGGWLRAVDQTTYVVDGGLNADQTVVQYTYEQLAKWWGDGFEQYLTTLHIEGQTDWKAFSVSIGTPFKPQTNVTELEGFAVSAGGWAQAGIDLTDEQRAMLKPGAVITVNYECAEPVWLIAIGENPLGGWLRAVDQNTFLVDGAVNEDGTTVQYTYEQLAAYWGDGFEQYLTTLQAEGKSDWKVYSVTIGQGPAAAAPVEEEEKLEAPDPTIQVADGEVVHTGSITFADTAWWTQNEMKYADIFGDVDPATVTAVKFYSDTNFVVGYNDTISGAWAQYDSAAEYVVKTMETESAIAEDKSVCIICLSKGDGVEYTINWEVYTGGSTDIIVPETPAEPVIDATNDTIEGTVIHTGSITFADSAWWTQNEMKYADIFGDLDPATVAGVKFYSDTTFVLGYTNAETEAWEQYDSKSDTYVVKKMLLDKPEGESVAIICLSKGDGVEYTITWEVYGKGEAAGTDTPVVDEPVASDDLVFTFAGLGHTGYGYVATDNGDAVDVTISGQYQEIQYVLPEVVDLAAYTTLIVDVVSTAALDIKLVNPEAVLNEYSQLTPFLDNYTAEGAITEPIIIDLTPYADMDLSQINFMAMVGDTTTLTINKITFTK